MVQEAVGQQSQDHSLSPNEIKHDHQLKSIGRLIMALTLPIVAGSYATMIGVSAGTTPDPETIAQNIPIIYGSIGVLAASVLGCTAGLGLYRKGDRTLPTSIKKA